MKSIVIIFSFLLAAVSLSSQEIYFQEDFENGYPNGWENDGAWAWGNMNELSSGQFSIEGNDSKFMAFNDNKQGSMPFVDGSLVTGSIDLTNVTGTVWLELNTFFPDLDFTGADETFEVFFTIDDGLSWESVQEYDEQPWFINAYQLDVLGGHIVRLAFTYNDGNAQNFGVAIDDVVISNGFVNARQKDYKLTVNGGSLFNEAIAGAAYTIDGLVFNYGFDTIQSFDINVNRDGVDNTFSFNGFNIAPLEVAKYDILEKIIIPDSYQEVNVSISNVNNTPDEDMDISDNSAIIKFDPIEVNPDKVVIVEEATGSWCSWCIGGTIYMNELSKRFGNQYSGMAIHSSGPMENVEHNVNIQDFPGFFGWPFIVVDRNQFMSPGNSFVTSVVQSLQEQPEARLKLGAALNNQELTTSLEIEFLEDLTNTDYSILIAIIEDGIIGDGGYAYLQQNAYSGGDSGPMGGMEFLPNAVSPELVPYNHVSRLLIGSYDGLTNVVTGNFYDGDILNHVFSKIDIDPEWNLANLKLAGLLLDANGEVLNGVYKSLDKVLADGLSSSTQVQEYTTQVNIYPNPLNDQNNLHVDLGQFTTGSYSLFNSSGQMLINNQSIEDSKFILDGAELPQGIYRLNLIIDKHNFSSSFIKL